MEDAADTAAQSESKPSARRGGRGKPKTAAQSESKPVKVKADDATPHAKAQEKWHKAEQKRKKGNPVVDTYYELVAGNKLVLCKKTKSGSVHRTFIGSITDKENGAHVKAKVEQLKNKEPEKLKYRI